MVRYCAVYGCAENSKINKNRRFFRFPADEQRCWNWIKLVGRSDLECKEITTLNTSYFVCELHFAESDCPKKYLRPFSVPTLLLPQMTEASTSSKYTQTEFNMLYIKSECLVETPTTSCNSQTANLEEPVIKKWKIMKPITDTASTSTNPDLPPLLKKIIDAQKISKCNSQGNKYDEEYIMLALNIYFASPVAYQHFSKLLRLPNIRTLQRRIAFGLSTKFDGNIIKWLQSKGRNLSYTEKFCTICAVEVPLRRNLYYQINKDKLVGLHEINEKQEKEIATRAIVVMARGIFAKWRQPLAFCFRGQNEHYSELYTWLDNIIARMIDIGFNVCAFVSNQSPIFINMVKNKSVTPENPFFFVNNKKIYYIFDVPQLIKSLRNTLINYDFVYQDDDELMASWNDIENMYYIEKDKKYKLCHKLTETHIRPNNFEKLHVKYATQVLSRTVAVTINTLVESGKLPDRCIGTTKFIKLINDTFDILNSSKINNDYKFKKAFNLAKYQINTLEKAQRIFSGLRVINRNNGNDVTVAINFIEGFLTSIKAITNLAADLKSEGYNHLCTRKLNQDPLNIFFKSKMPQPEKNHKPTAIQFHTTFNKMFVISIIKLSKNNCTEHLNQLLMRIEEFQNVWKREQSSPESLGRCLQLDTVDYRLELPKENAFLFISEYLLRKCYERHMDCEIFRNYIEMYDKVNDSNTNQTSISPLENFKQYIKVLDSICEDHFKNCDFYRIGSEVMSKINETIFELPCPCFPLEFLRKLFVRFRIYNVIQHNNRIFRDRSVKRNFLSICPL